MLEPAELLVRKSPRRYGTEGQRRIEDGEDDYIKDKKSDRQPNHHAKKPGKGTTNPLAFVDGRGITWTWKEITTWKLNSQLLSAFANEQLSASRGSPDELIYKELRDYIEQYVSEPVVRCYITANGRVKIKKSVRRYTRVVVLCKAFPLPNACIPALRKCRLAPPKKEKSPRR